MTDEAFGGGHPDTNNNTHLIEMVVYFVVGSIGYAYVKPTCDHICTKLFPIGLCVFIFFKMPSLTSFNMELNIDFEGIQKDKDTIFHWKNEILFTF